ncbi:hypothetical protein DRE_07387 [Drechslerella stenobrocha 248]|uniref:Uncharacterized protein n=1 Tax=Drechslerella stenobrocha 248 TaxID=1043628 RepID=W7HUI7_9PEZI|nr:hypothetical protein DRE_07387 [Drechslerella stenobrocha 248]
MASLKSILMLAAVAAVGASSPTDPTATSGETACAAIASMQVAYHSSYAAQNPGATYTPLLSAPVALATECLYSVPIDRKVALEQLNGIQRYLQFQTTLAFLKNPPKEDSFQAPEGLDLVAQINQLAHRVRAKEITKEYDFELKLRSIFASANDGHLTGAMGALFAIQFDSPFDIVSVSKDGISLPEIYRAGINKDGRLEAVGPSIVEIDGLKVTDYLNKISFGGGLQSPDARYNNLFPGKGLRGQVLNNGYFRHRRRYPGKDGFSVKFADGTTEDFQFIATIAGNFAKVTDAASFYNVFVKGGQLINRSATLRYKDPEDGAPRHEPRIGMKPELWEESEPLSAPQADLKPEVQDPAGVFAGYFLKDDTAVIQLLAFTPGYWSGVPATIRSISRFLDLCRQRGAKKLIVDITNNGGGDIMMGYDLFMQLFPRTLPYSGQRMRSNPGGRIEAKAFGHLSFKDLEAMAYSNNATISNMAYAVTWSNWAYSVLLDQDYKPFLNAAQLIGPVKANNDVYSPIWRFNATEPIFGLGVQDYLSKPGLAPVFKPENIVLLTDGRCSSTCSTFSEFMQTQKGIKSVAVGGIPTPGRGMPLVGGVRGTEILSFRNLLDAARAVDILSPTQNQEELNRRKRDLPRKLPLPISGNVNSLDNVRKGESTPLQFIEDHANCRMFHTPATLASIEALWRVVDDAAFGSGRGCAVGSLKN